MNLALHQFKTEVRTFRIWWLLWFALLVLDCVIKQSGMGLCDDYSELKDLTLKMSNIMNWTFFLFVPALVMLGASPSRPDSFWSTRPMPKWSLYFGKALFVLVFIVLAAVVQEGGWLASKGLSSGVVIRGMYERLLFSLPLVAGSMAFAALCKNVGEAIQGMVVVGGGVLFVTILVLCFSNYFLRTELIQEGVSLYLTLVYLCSLALIITAVLSTRWHWSVSVRWGAAIVCGLVVILGIGPHVKSKVTVDSMDSGITAKISKMPVTIVPFMETHQRYTWLDTIRGSVVADVPALPKDCTIRWMVVSAELKSASGEQIGWNGSMFHPRLQNISLPAPVSEDPIPLSRLMGSNVLVMGSSEPRDSRSGSLPSIGVAQNVLSRKMTMETDLTGSIFRWKKVGILSLKTGSITNDEDFWVKVESAKNFTSTPNINRVSVQLKIGEPNLLTTSEWKYRFYPDWPKEKYAFLLFNSKKSLAIAADGICKVASIAIPSAFKECLLIIPFGLQMEPQQFLKDFKAGEYSLMILKSEYLGRISHHWDLADFTLPKGTLEVTGPGNVVMKEKNYEKKLLAMSPPGDSRLEAGRYLSEVISYLESRGDWTDEDFIAWQPKLQRLMPKQLPLMLDTLSMSGINTTSLLLECLSKGALENQKEEIIKAFWQNPRLAAVIEERGWHEEAMPVYEYYLRSPVPLAKELFVGLRKHPQCLPRLFQEIRYSRSWTDILEMDDVANSLPDARKQLDSLVEGMWNERKEDFHVSGHDGPHAIQQVYFSKEMLLAIQHGNRQAFERACRIIGLINPAWVGMDCCGLESLVNTGFTWGGLSKILKKHKPEDFIFNHNERRFVLKQNLTK